MYRQATDLREPKAMLRNNAVFEAVLLIDAREILFSEVSYKKL